MEYDNLEVLVNYVGNFFWQIATRIETEGGANISWHLLATAFDHQFSGWLAVMIHYQFFSPSASFLITANEDGALSKFHAIFTITGFSDWCHLLKQSHASISAQLLSVGNEKALINHCMVINVRLRKHFQMQIWPKRWGKPVMNLLDIFRIKIKNGILTPLPYPLKQDKALCRFLCQIYQTFLIFETN